MTYQTDVQIGDIIEGIEVNYIEYDEDEKLYTFYGDVIELAKPHSFLIHEETIVDNYGGSGEHKVKYFYDANNKKRFIEAEETQLFVKQYMGDLLNHNHSR